MLSIYNKHVSECRPNRDSLDSTKTLFSWVAVYKMANSIIPPTAFYTDVRVRARVSEKYFGANKKLSIGFAINTIDSTRRSKWFQLFSALWHLFPKGIYTYYLRKFNILASTTSTLFVVI